MDELAKARTTLAEATAAHELLRSAGDCVDRLALHRARVRVDVWRKKVRDLERQSRISDGTAHANG